jgi:orotate phosphoribosyltransferase
MKLPLQPLSIENAYGDPELLHDLGVCGAALADRLDVEVVVGGECAGIPLAAAISLVSHRPFAFVRKPGYRGHEVGEPAVRGADVLGRRVLLVEDAIWRGHAVEGFLRQLTRSGAQVVGAFCLVDMRDVAESVTSACANLPTESISGYLDLLAAAADNGALDPITYQLAVDAIVNRWNDDDPRWLDLGEAS